MSFAQSSITIGKGSSITLVDDTSTLHVIANGSWVNGTAQSMQEHGAPTMNNMQISGSGSTQSVGPFTAAGTFHLYCPVHPGMNLTVVVK
jgi:plastocyanin